MNRGRVMMSQRALISSPTSSVDPRGVHDATDTLGRVIAVDLREQY